MPDRNMNNHLHDGHRDRMREKFLKIGFENMEDHEILEMMLFYCIPRKDTNETAHILLNSLGTLVDVFEAPIDSLEIYGLSHNAAIYIKMMMAFCRKYYVDKMKNKSFNLHEGNIKERIYPQFIGINDHERLIVLLLDTHGRELYSGVVNEGTLSSATIDIKKIQEVSLKYHAWGAIIAHNHPSGLPVPSKSDIEVTRLLREKLAAINVQLLDHFIVCEHDCVSMAMDEQYEDIFYG